MREEISKQVANAAILHKQIVTQLGGMLPDNFLTPASFRINRSIAESTEKLASSLNSTQYQLLLNQGPKLFIATLELAKECGFSISELNLLSSGEADVWRGYNLKKLVRTYLEVRVILEKYLLAIYGPLTDLYSYYRIPNQKVQLIFIEQMDSLELGPEFTFIDIEGSGLKTEGYPDLTKFKNLEQESYFLALELSVASQLVVASEYFSQIFKDYDSSATSGIVEELLEDMYRQVFQFIYKQLYHGRYSWDQIKLNTTEKYQRFFLTSLSKKLTEVNGDEVIKDLLANEVRLYSEVIDELKTGITSPGDLLDLEGPRVYRVDLRERNAFETRHLDSFFSADIYLYEGITGYKDVLVDCYTLGYSMLTYKLIAELLN